MMTRGVGTSVRQRVNGCARHTSGQFVRPDFSKSTIDWHMAMHESSPADVSLICTVLNEAGSIDELMRSIAAQTLRPREVIIVDGGSRDGTQLHVEWWHGRLGCPLRLIEHAGANISAGRNAG